MSNTLLKEEWVGLDIEILSSRNPSNQGIKGKLLDETFHTLTIFHNGKVKRLMKRNVIFKIKKNDHWYKINGSTIEFRPEDRVKKIK